MARVTIEDCLEKIPNRFHLVLIATKRARQIERGSMPLVEAENDKPSVLALREIAEGKIGAAILREDDVDKFGSEAELHPQHAHDASVSGQTRSDTDEHPS